MKALLVILITLSAASASACMVGPNWEQETMAKADKNNDGKISYDEYKGMHSFKPDEEKFIKNSWNAALKNKNYLTKEEFLGGQRPKCRGSE